MGLAAMLAESSMKGGAGASNIEDISADDAAYVEGCGTTDDEAMETVDEAQNTVQPTIDPSQVAINAGVVSAADGYTPPDASEQPPPGKPVVEAQE